MKLDIPSSPIITTPLNNFDNLDQTLNDNLEQTNHTILPKRKIGVTAIVARIRSGPELRPKVKTKINIENQKLVVKKKSQNEKYSGFYLIVDQMETYCFIKRNRERLPLFD